MAKTPEEKAAEKAAKQAEKDAAKAAKEAEAEAAKAAKEAEKEAAKALKDAEKAGKDSVTVTWRGNSRVYSKEIHGDDFLALAKQFAGKYPDAKIE